MKSDKQPSLLEYAIILVLVAFTAILVRFLSKDQLDKLNIELDNK